MATKTYTLTVSLYWGDHRQNILVFASFFGVVSLGNFYSKIESEKKEKSILFM